MAISSVTNSINANILNNTFNQSEPKTNPANNLLEQVINQPYQNQTATKTDLLAGVAEQQISQTSKILSGLGSGDTLTNQLVSFSVNANNQLAADQLPDEYSKTVGSIIDLTI
mgnify:CR=1 FL=1